MMISTSTPKSSRRPENLDHSAARQRRRTRVAGHLDVHYQAFQIADASASDFRLGAGGSDSPPNWRSRLRWLVLDFRPPKARLPDQIRTTPAIPPRGESQFQTECGDRRAST